MNTEELRGQTKKQSRLHRWRYLGCGCLFLVVLTIAGASAALYVRHDSSLAFVPAPGEPSATATPTTMAETAVATRTVDSFPGRIAFTNEIGQIGTVDPDGENEHLITDDRGIFLFPAWSPTAQMLAAIHLDQEQSGVFVMDDAEQAALTELYTHVDEAPIYLYWSPDGTHVSFIAQYGQRLGLYLAPADGSRESQLLTSGQPLYWDWMNGARVLVHTGGTGPGAQLSVVNVTGEGGNGQKVADPGYFQAPGVALHGTQFAYAAVDLAGARWLVVEDIETGEAERIPHFGLTAMGWSPTANEVAFISPEMAENGSPFNFYGPLRLFEPESGDVRVLTEDTVIAFFWAPDGQSIAYLTVAGDENDQVAQGIAQTHLVRLAPVQQREQFELNLWLVDLASERTRLLLQFQPSELFVFQFLPFFDQYALSHRLWAPDSRALVMPVVSDGLANIHVVPVSGRSSYPVARGSIAFWSTQ